MGEAVGKAEIVHYWMCGAMNMRFSAVELFLVKNQTSGGLKYYFITL